MKRTPSVAIVGRVNVGKSSLFNRLVEERKAIVSTIPGTTRDWTTAECHWRGRTFMLMDTGGLEHATPTSMDTLVHEQTLRAVEVADMILFVLAGDEGVVPADTAIASIVRKSRKPVLVVVNKSDRVKKSEQYENIRADVLKFGFDEPAFVSARSGRSSGDMLDALFVHLPRKDAAHEEAEWRLAIIGKPNTGKSTLMNALAGSVRVITSSEPHTTREPQEHLVMFEKHRICIIDTAGIRKKSLVRRKSRDQMPLEEQSIEKSIIALAQADIAVLVLDITEPLTSQDTHLAGSILDERKGLIIACNKWDQVPQKTPATLTRYEHMIRRRFPFLSWAPVIFFSALEKTRIRDILLMSVRIHENMNRTVPNEVLLALQKRIDMPKALPLLSLTQTGTNPPHFEAEFGGRDGIPVSLQRKVVNRIRETADCTGSPIILHARQPLRR